MTFLSSFAYAQKKDEKISDLARIYKSFDSKYGLDNFLVNGQVFTNKYFDAVGHPFFLEDDSFNKADLIIAGKRYKDVLIKYETHKQEILASVEDEWGKREVLILQREFIEKFYLKDKEFIPSVLKEEPFQFYQMLGDGELRVAIKWWKDFHTPKSSMLREYRYTSRKKAYYLIHNSEYVQLRRKKDFWKIFPENKKEIRKYLNDSSFSFYDITDETLYALLDILQQYSFINKNE